MNKKEIPQSYYSHFYLNLAASKCTIKTATVFCLCRYLRRN